jgi:16S rRNA (guanine966-N2)-methyltransferase
VRVIAGRLGGRRLVVPRPAGARRASGRAAGHAGRGSRAARAPTPVGDALRPTSDRVREALFGRLGALDGARVLDLFAGVGALGIEALSRGAARAVFVERAAPALAALRTNLASLGLEAVARVVRGDAVTVAARLGHAGERFDLVLLDPPYASGQAEPALRALLASGALAPDATVVVETGRRHPVPPVPGLRRVDERRYGDTVLLMLAPQGRPDADGGSTQA